MEPIGLALARSPLNIAAILMFVVAALFVFLVARYAKNPDEDED